MESAPTMKKTAKTWVVYMLQCSDNSLYTGITNDLPKRVEAHNKGKGARYTRGRAPVSVVYQQDCDSKSDALKKEISLKKLPTEKKRALCQLSQGQRSSIHTAALPRMKSAEPNV
jgi:putative endonuclease